MRCPFCSADETRVIDSRLSEDGSSVRRRRECEVCSERFTTFERAELRLPQVVKSDGRRQPFHEEKLRAGMTAGFGYTAFLAVMFTFVWIAQTHAAP